MKRVLTVAILNLVASIAFSGTAMAYGYHPTDSTFTAGTMEDGYLRPAQSNMGVYSNSTTAPWSGNPHGDYSSTSNKCKTCHAVHQAGDPDNGGQAYKLLRALSADDACDYCHGGSGAHTKRLVYGYSGGIKTATTISDFNGHRIGASLTAIPDGLKESAGDPPNRPEIGDVLTCSACHSVHGAKAISFNGKKTMILRQDPYGDGGTIASAQDYNVAGSKLAEFCADCHDANTEVGMSHPLSLANGKYAYSDAQNCLYCHNSPGAPHGSSSSGDNMLTGRVSGVNVGKSTSAGGIDDVCVRCHQNGDRTAGVGLTW